MAIAGANQFSTDLVIASSCGPATAVALLGFGFVAQRIIVTNDGPVSIRAQFRSTGTNATTDDAEIKAGEVFDSDSTFLTTGMGLTTTSTTTSTSGGEAKRIRVQAFS